MSNELIQSRFTKRNMAKKHLLIAVSISARWHLVTTMSLNPTSWQILLTTQQRLHCGAKTLCGSLLSMYSPGDVVKKNIFFSCSGIPSCQQHLGLLANDHLARTAISTVLRSKINRLGNVTARFVLSQRHTSRLCGRTGKPSHPGQMWGSSDRRPGFLAGMRPGSRPGVSRRQQRSFNNYCTFLISGWNRVRGPACAAAHAARVSLALLQQTRTPAALYNTPTASVQDCSATFRSVQKMESTVTVS